VDAGLARATDILLLHLANPDASTALLSAFARAEPALLSAGVCFAYRKF
jgi:hypothetical protein